MEYSDFHIARGGNYEILVNYYSTYDEEKETENVKTEEKSNLNESVLVGEAEEILESDRYFLPTELTTQIDRLKWNSEFQKLLDFIRKNPFAKTTQNVTKLAQLHRLYSNFLLTARVYAKIIVEEYSLPPAEKTLKPSSVGGIAGGDKYIAEGIFFKFALDSAQLYGGHSNAQKSAGHELRSLSALLSQNVDGLCYPLIVVIDYLGFRVSCISLLPVSKQSLKYGSADGGKTMHLDDSQLVEKINLVAKKLKPHLVGENKVTVSTPLDLEGHLGDDERFYILDSARLFPPETPSGRGTFLYRLLRPEFVASYKTPLCSDAFSRFLQYDPNREIHNQEVKEATEYLQKQVVSSFASWLENNYPLQKDGKPKKEAELVSLTTEMHKRGLNMRLLGAVFDILPKESHWRDRLANEMVLRIAKGTIRVLWRKVMEKIQIRLSEPYVVLVVNFMNLLLGSSASSRKFWTTELLKSIKKSFFYYANKSEEDPNLVNALRRVDKSRLLREFCEKTGVILVSKFDSQKFKLERPFSERDIQSIEPTQKSLSIIDFSLVFRMIDDILMFDPLSNPNSDLDPILEQTKMVYTLLRENQVPRNVSHLITFAKAAFYIDNHTHLLRKKCMDERMSGPFQLLSGLTRNQNGIYDLHLLTCDKVMHIINDPELFEEAIAEKNNFYEVLNDWASVWLNVGGNYLIYALIALACASIASKKANEEKMKANLQSLSNAHSNLIQKKAKLTEEGLEPTLAYYQQCLEQLNQTDLLTSLKKRFKFK